MNRKKNELIILLQKSRNSLKDVNVSLLSKRFYSLIESFNCAFRSFIEKVSNVVIEFSTSSMMKNILKFSFSSNVYSSMRILFSIDSNWRSQSIDDRCVSSKIRTWIRLVGCWFWNEKIIFRILKNVSLLYIKRQMYSIFEVEIVDG